MIQLRAIVALWVYLQISLLGFSPPARADQPRFVIDRFGDLAPLPEAQPLLIRTVKFLNSSAVLSKCQKSEDPHRNTENRTLDQLRKRLLAGLQNLNFAAILGPEVTADAFPYDAIYLAPFPRRPTLETLEEAIHFTRHFLPDQPAVELLNELLEFSPYKDFSNTLEKRFRKTETEKTSRERGNTIPSRIFKKEDLTQNPVDSYITFKQRIDLDGERAPFPEFKEAVDQAIQGLDKAEIVEQTKHNAVFRSEVEAARDELRLVSQNEGLGRGTEASFSAAYPYHRTLKALEQAAGIFDLIERLKYPESINWNEVELSWLTQNEFKTVTDEEKRVMLSYPVEGPRLMPPYQVPRHKYRSFLILSDPNVILFPWYGDATLEDLIRLRSAPIGILGLTEETLRVDRFYTTPLDFWVHDGNHMRKMNQYDLRWWEKEGIKTDEERIASMRARQAFIESLIRETIPLHQNPEEDEIRETARVLLFEVFHESALPAEKELILTELRRTKDVLQGFERRNQNLDYLQGQGAKTLLDLSKPIELVHFLGKTHGFLTGVDNRLRWGFYESVFKTRAKHPQRVELTSPELLAKAVARLYELLGEPAPSKENLLQIIHDHPEGDFDYRFPSLRGATPPGNKVGTSVDLPAAGTTESVHLK